MALRAPEPRLETPDNFARRTVAHAFHRNPNDVWTRENLASWYGLPLALVEEAVAVLLLEGSIEHMPGDGYRAVAHVRSPG
jgi:hypothetical protein